MLIIRVMGGLGNQLFQYALYELLRRKGKDAVLDISHYNRKDGNNDKRTLDLLLFQELHFETCTEKEKWKYLDERNHFVDKVRYKLGITYNYATLENRQYMPEIFEMEEGYLQGYWNSERYSGEIEVVLQDKLRFPEPVDERNRKLAEEMRSTDSISIHVRRGDYLLPENQKVFGNICTEAYYKSAVSEMKKRCAMPVFYIFCEDSDYIKEHVKNTDVRIVDWNKGRDSIFDMYLMSCCKGNICANSTFSIWAAKLNTRTDKLRIRPEVLDNGVKQDEEEIRVLKQNGWILLDKSGRILN